ncbi:MAG: hypothetical protein SGILL_005991 [Bacillariaceae sp.]
MTVEPPELHLSFSSLKASDLINNGRFQQFGDRVRDIAALCSLVSLDVSHIFVSNAAALCARIIGVKHDSGVSRSKTDGDDDDENYDNDENSRRVHYYIDDGKYGSLNFLDLKSPIPLQQKAGTQEQCTATIWGPTCDGLDKVCSDVTLPLLSRDDWLVFTDLSPNLTGTCFNGFSAPDVAYCVLGDYGV